MKWLAIGFSLLIVLVILLADLGAIPPVVKSIYDFPYGDKLGHILLYGFLALLLNLNGLGNVQDQHRKRYVFTVGLFLCLFIGLEEISQIFISQRSFDLLDLGASLFGVVLFSWIAFSIRTRRASFYS